MSFLSTFLVITLVRVLIQSIVDVEKAERCAGEIVVVLTTASTWYLGVTVNLIVITNVRALFQARVAQTIAMLNA